MVNACLHIKVMYSRNLIALKLPIAGKRMGMFVWTLTTHGERLPIVPFSLGVHRLLTECSKPFHPFAIRKWVPGAECFAMK